MNRGIKYAISLCMGLASCVFVYAAGGVTVPVGTTPVTTTPCIAESRCLFGNGGTNAQTNFIGTTDATDLVFKTNNAARMWLTSDGVLGIKTSVGIKASSPKATLQVGGSVMFGNNHPVQLSTSSNASDSDPTAINNAFSSILGGETNSISYLSNDSSIGGGKNNTIDGDFSFIGGGSSNTIEGSNSVIPGGYSNYAKNGAFAAGMYAKAQHKYSFVWNDGSINPFTTTNTNQFLINASRGVGINTNVTSGATLTVNGSIKGSYKAANGAVGITQVVNLKKSNGNSCTMTITNGIITATSC